MGAHRETKTEVIVEEVEVTKEVTLTVTLEADVESVEAELVAYRQIVVDELRVPLEYVVAELAGGSAVVTFSIRQPNADDAVDVDLSAVAEQVYTLTSADLSALLNVTVLVMTNKSLKNKALI